jgi:hypothetical protein
VSLMMYEKLLMAVEVVVVVVVVVEILERVAA